MGLLDADIKGLNVDVTYVWTGGNWVSGDKEGYYRFVVSGGGHEHYKSKLYVQWLLHGSDMDLPKVLASVNVAELNDNPLYAFTLPVCIDSKTCQTVEIEAVHSYEFTKIKIVLKFDGVGSYTYSMSPITSR